MKRAFCLFSALIIIAFSLISCSRASIETIKFSGDTVYVDDELDIYSFMEYTSEKKSELSQEGETISEKAEDSARDTATGIDKTIDVNEDLKPVAELVWVPTNGGSKYHAKASCNNMIEPRQVTKSAAVAEGFEPCKRCY